MDKDNQVLILYGDVPLIHSDTLIELLDVQAEADMAILTVSLMMQQVMDEFYAVLMVKVEAIVEHKDATDEQKKVKEVNTGIMAVNGNDLVSWLASLNNNNSQGEYYLTDIIALAAQEGKELLLLNPPINMKWKVLIIEDNWPT